MFGCALSTFAIIAWLSAGVHLGSSMAINEAVYYPPGSYFVEYFPHQFHPPGAPASANWGQGHPTGETCGSVFWIKCAPISCR